MIHSETRVATPHASRYIKRLCRHFAHKVPASFSDDQGEIHFAFGDCRLSATTAHLAMALEATISTDLDRLQKVMGSHLERMALRDDPLQVHWDRLGTESTAEPVPGS